MTAFIDTLLVQFPTSYTGLAASAQYQVTGADGTIHQAFTASGVAEKATSPGTYYVRGVALDDSWLPVEIDWQIVGEDIGASDLITQAPAPSAATLTTAIAAALLAHPGTPLANNAATGSVQIDLTQRYDQSTYAKGSLGHWLLRGWGKLFGKSVATPSLNKIDYYRPDDATIDHTDTFDNIAAPLSRNSGGTS